MATLVVQQVTRAGLNQALVAAAGGGDAFPNDGRTWVEVNNADGTPTTVTIVIQKLVDGKTVTNPTVSVTNATRFAIGPFPPEFYNDANGLVQLTYSKVTSLTVNPFRA